MKVGLIGLGEFGRNHLRVLKELGHEVITCDIKEQADYNDYRLLILRSGIDAIIIATPASTHYEIACCSLAVRIPTFVEKPITLLYSHASLLNLLSERNNTILAVGQIFRYHPLTKKLIEVMSTEVLPKVLAVKAQRLGMRTPRDDVGVLYDFIVHDIDLINYLFGEVTKETKITCCKTSLLGREHEDFCVVVYTQNGMYIQIDADWITPVKTRTLTIITNNRAYIADYIKEELRIHTIESVPMSVNEGEYRFNTRMGDILIPKISHEEPLKEELKDFLKCVQTKEQPISNAKSVLPAMWMLELIKGEK